jgi:transcriptional regulator with XRE-family HTH domain
MRRLQAPDPRINFLSDQVAHYFRIGTESGIELAERIGVHPSQVSRLLKKRHKTVNRSVRKICDAVGVSVPEETFSASKEPKATLNEVIGKITGDDTERIKRLTHLLQIIASLAETE